MLFPASVLVVATFAVGWASPLTSPLEERFTKEDAGRMIRASEGSLSPVYTPLAKYLVERLDLPSRNGIGVDLGGGPGNLVIELCKRTRLYWVNVDANPHFSPHFLSRADEEGVGDRVGSVFGDAQALPFRDDYADVVVSRGSFQFWEDKALAFREIYRVLKPGGVAFVGRGFSPSFPVGEALRIRAGQMKCGKLWSQYSVSETEEDLRTALHEAEIREFHILIPEKHDANGKRVNYGIWVQFVKGAK